MVCCVTECRTACMLCCFGTSLQCCVSGSSHCDEMSRLEKHSSLGPGRELFGGTLEDLSGQCWMLACSVWGLLRRSCRRPRRRRKSRRVPRFWTLRVRCVRHVVHDDSRRFVIKRSELRAWAERDQLRAEYSESLMVERGTVNHVLAGLPVGAPEGAELVGEDVRERETD